MAGALAYFRWLNAHGGVYGRKVVYRVLDDHGDARMVPSLVHQLVQGDAVFAVFGAAASAEDAVASQFLSSAKVPDVFAGSACGCMNLPGKLPEVFGWPLGGVREGKILGSYVSSHYRGTKVTVFYSPDQTSHDELAGFKDAARGLKLTARVAAAGKSGAAADVAVVRAAGAQVTVTLTSSAVTTQVAAALSAAKFRLPLVASGSGLAAGLPDGVITDSFLPSSAAPGKSPSAGWISVFRKIRDAYLRQAQFGPAMIDGMAEAYEMAAAMFRAGQALTQQALVAALNGMPAGPAVAPLAYTATDHVGAEGAYVGVIRNGVIVPATGVMVTDATPAGQVTPSSYPQQRAPASGLPPR